MKISIEPVQINFIATCSSLDVRILELMEHSIILFIEFFTLDHESIYRCKLHLSPEEIQEWKEDQLDLIQWIFMKFKISKIQNCPTLKRKDLEPLDQEISIKKNKLD